MAVCTFSEVFSEQEADLVLDVLYSNGKGVRRKGRGRRVRSETVQVCVCGHGGGGGGVCVWI